MQNSVGSHIETLQKRLEQLNLDMMNSDLNRVQRNRVEAEIRWVNLALNHFRAALAAKRKNGVAG